MTDKEPTPIEMRAALVEDVKLGRYTQEVLVAIMKAIDSSPTIHARK